MLTVRGQRQSFSTHERVFLGKCQSFWDRKCLDLRGKLIYIYIYIYILCVCVRVRVYECICIYDRCCFAMLLYGFGTSFLHLLRVSRPPIPSRVAWRFIYLIGHISDPLTFTIYKYMVYNSKRFLLTLYAFENGDFSPLYIILYDSTHSSSSCFVVFDTDLSYTYQFTGATIDTVSVTWASSSRLLNPATWIHRLSP